MFWRARLEQALSRQEPDVSFVGSSAGVACPRLVPHHSVVAEQARHGRACRQGIDLGRRLRLQLGAVADDRRTGD
jgi:hypothetical protein